MLTVWEKSNYNYLSLTTWLKTLQSKRSLHGESLKARSLFMLKMSATCPPVGPIPKKSLFV